MLLVWIPKAFSSELFIFMVGLNTQGMKFSCQPDEAFCLPVSFISLYAPFLINHPIDIILVMGICKNKTILDINEASWWLRR